MPLLNGFVAYSSLFKTRYIGGGSFIEQEFLSRGLLADYTRIKSEVKLATYACRDCLKIKEKVRFGEEVNAKLKTFDAEYDPGSNGITTRVAQLKKKIIAAGEEDISKYETDMSKYFRQISETYDSFEL